MTSLGRIVAATVSVAELEPVVAAYRQYLGYRPVAEGTVATALAESWAAPAAADARYALLAPEAADDFLLRLVAGPQAPGFIPLRVSGWAGLVLSASDLATLAQRLQGSPFTIIDKLREAPVVGGNHRAFQVQGPANEILTFVEATAEGSGVPKARGPVDGAFAAILACAELDRGFEFYHYKFMAEPAKERLVALWAVNDAFGVDRPSKHRTTLVPLAGSSLIELQQYPDGATRRPLVPRHLPPGIALLTIESATSLDDVSVYSLTGPQAYDELPYRQRRQMTFYGAANEMIELIEA